MNICMGQIGGFQRKKNLRNSMDIPKDVLENVILGVKTFLAEYEMMNEVKRLCTEKVPTYAESLYNLGSSVENLLLIRSRGLLEHRAISFSMLNILALELSNLNKDMRKVQKWNNIRSKRGCCKWAKKFLQDSPSKINDLLINSLEKIMPNLYLIEELESSIFGTAIKIENKLLRDAWMMMGANQLNDSSINKNILIENIFLLLKKEIGELRQPMFWKKKVELFVDILDGNISSADGQISVAELNEIPAKYRNYSKLSDLLIDMVDGDSNPVLLLRNTGNNEEKEKKVEKNRISLDINYSPRKIDASYGKNVPKCDGYGSAGDWKADIVGSFEVPLCEDNQLLNIELKVEATDQGWGGTGHSQVRYQVNEEKPMVGFSINRKVNDSGEYEIIIGGDKVRSGNIVKIWAFCPPWNGWEVNIVKIKGDAIFLCDLI